MLPKSLKNISSRALGNIRLYELDTSKYTYYTYWSNNDYATGTPCAIFYSSTIEKCYINNPIFENNFGTTIGSSSPVAGVNAMSVYENMYIKNITKLGQYSIYKCRINN